MKRRRFLLATGGGLLVMLGPAWLERAFGDASLKGAIQKEDPRFGDQARRRALARAKGRALAANKPLLVFVIPRDENVLWDRGHAFGELLAHGTPAQLAPLAHAELACATLDDLGASAPAKDDPLFALVDPRSNETRLFALPAPLPTLDKIERWAIDPRDGEKPIDENAYIDRRIALLADLAEKAVGPARAPELGRQVRARYETEPPSGTHWANDSACGPTHVEETTAEKIAREAEEKRQRALGGGIVLGRAVVAYGCGMGHVPAKSTRFLYFFTKDPDAE